ncbi:MAG: hypothetical protein GC166_10970 [Alphaproteobacteria bacterium]|nr:hypothetical protein [Alphaproteobacteria bacterium]
MHAERLNSIVTEICKTFQDTKIQDQLVAIIVAVTNRAKAPATRAHDEQISNLSKIFLADLEELSTKDFSPTWRKLILELDLSLLLPENIRSEFEKAFDTRSVDSDLLNSLNQLKRGIATKLDAVRKLRDGFAAIGLATDELEPEAVEFNVAMPRESIDDRLAGFSKELAKLNVELQVLSSIAKQPPTALTISSVSSNDFSVALSINIDLGEIVAYVLVALYSMRAVYRAKIDALSSDALKELPQEILKQAHEWANAYVKNEIREIVRRLPTECALSVDADKLEANAGPVAQALEYIEEKQERGFNMDVRAGQISKEVLDNPNNDDTRRRELSKMSSRLAEIESKSAHLKILKRQKTPILSLTKVNSEDGLA